jgi:hypothetical protein
MASSDVGSPTAIIGAITGVCALGLSIYNTVIEQRKTRTRVAIEVSFAFTTKPVTTVVAVKGINMGQTDVNFTSCGLAVPGNQYVFFMRTRFLPKTVSARDSVYEVEDLNDIKVGLSDHGFSGKVEAFGFVDDATGRRHRSKKPLIIDLDE